MLPQLLSLLNLGSTAHRDRLDDPEGDAPLSEFVCDSKLSVSETTHTEFSRALDAFDEPKPRR